MTIIRLMGIDEYRDDLKNTLGIANIMIIERNISMMPYDVESVIIGQVTKKSRPEVEKWCRESLSGNCRIEHVNKKIWFELTVDAIMFYLTWKEVEE